MCECLYVDTYIQTSDAPPPADEHPAAMQTGAAMLTDPPNIWGMLLVVALALLFVQAHPHLAHTNLPPPALHLQEASEGAAEGPDRTASTGQTLADAEARLRFSDILSKTQNASGFSRLQFHGFENGVDMQTHEDRRHESGQRQISDARDAALHPPRALEMARHLSRSSRTEGLRRRNPLALKGGGALATSARQTLGKRSLTSMADVRGPSSSPSGGESSGAMAGPRVLLALRTVTSPTLKLVR